jgi:hypothetical protein
MKIGRMTVLSGMNSELLEIYAFEYNRGGADVSQSRIGA